jgi:hypothetical protein
LTWQVLQPLSQAYSVDVRIVDTNGQILAQQEHETFSIGSQSGEKLTDTYNLEITGNRPNSANLEVRLLNDSGQNVLLESGFDTAIILEVQKQTSWQIAAQ